MKKSLWAKTSLCASLLVLSAGNAWAGLADYGVIIGKPVGHSLYTAGQWPHYHISVQPAGGPLYDSALDLFSPSQANAVEVAHREIVLHPRNASLYGYLGQAQFEQSAAQPDAPVCMELHVNLRQLVRRGEQAIEPHRKVAEPALAAGFTR